MAPEADSDKAILNEFSYTVYASMPEVCKRSLELALLMEIVRSNNEVDDNYLSLDNCSNLLQRDPQFRARLLSCWKDGSFQSVRKSGEWAFNLVVILSAFPHTLPDVLRLPRKPKDGRLTGYGPGKTYRLTINSQANIDPLSIADKCRYGNESRDEH
jgi:hypothetical protein